MREINLLGIKAIKIWKLVLFLCHLEFKVIQMNGFSFYKKLAKFLSYCIIRLHLIKSDGGTSPVKSHQPIELGGNARTMR